MLPVVICDLMVITIDIAERLRICGQLFRLAVPTMVVVSIYLSFLIITTFAKNGILFFFFHNGCINCRVSSRSIDISCNNYNQFLTIF